MAHHEWGARPAPLPRHGVQGLSNLGKMIGRVDGDCERAAVPNCRRALVAGAEAEYTLALQHHPTRRSLPKGEYHMTEQQRPTDLAQRIVQFPAVRILLAIVWVFVAVAAAQFVVALLPAQETAPVAILAVAVSVSMACVAYLAYVRIVEKRRASELAASGAIAELAAGILTGAALFTVTIGILWALGCYAVTGTNDWTAMLPAFTAATFAGVVEEILFRGVLFRIVEEWLGSWPALLASALVFGLLHLMNPNATLIAGVAIALEAGIMLAAAYMLTRRLWLAIGIHFAWNFTQGGVFGVAVSGTAAHGLVQSVLTGPEILSGGAFGAEASIVAVVVCLAAGAYLLWRVYRKGNLVKPFWRR